MDFKELITFFYICLNFGKMHGRIYSGTVAASRDILIIRKYYTKNLLYFSFYIFYPHKNKK